MECFNEGSVAPGGLLHLSDDVVQVRKRERNSDVFDFDLFYFRLEVH